MLWKNTNKLAGQPHRLSIARIEQEAKLAFPDFCSAPSCVHSLERQWDTSFGFEDTELCLPHLHDPNIISSVASGDSRHLCFSVPFPYHLTQLLAHISFFVSVHWLTVMWGNQLLIRFWHFTQSARFKYSQVSFPEGFSIRFQIIFKRHIIWFLFFNFIEV